MNMQVVSDLVAKALRVAALYHKNQNRKGTEIPYIVHPVEVAMILQENGMEDEVIAAGLLHDILEDTELEENDLRGIFNDRIAELVLGASEPLEDRDNIPWEERKEHTINFLKNAERDIQILACADKLSNVKSMLRNYKKLSDKLWEKFNRDYEKQKFYYTSLVESLQDLEGNEIYEEFKLTVQQLFR